MPPVIVVFPDCFTPSGGNQYINSSAIGRYADYLNQEIVPLIDSEFLTLASADTAVARENHLAGSAPCEWA